MNKFERVLIVLLVIVALVSAFLVALTFSTDVGAMELPTSEALAGGLIWVAVTIAVGLVILVIVQVRRARL